MFRLCDEVVFPEATDLNINMMPIFVGVDDSIPDFAVQYTSLIRQCSFRRGSLAYLSVSEGMVHKGTTQRRPGLHTEATSDASWGGIPWGGRDPEKGVYMASTNGLCRVWDCLSYEVDAHGALLQGPSVESNYVDTEPNILYWITDRTPHESLAQPRDEYRQWFRLVSDEVGVWYAQHSTPNPLGVQPRAPIQYSSKFECRGHCFLVS